MGALPVPGAETNGGCRIICRRGWSTSSRTVRGCSSTNGWKDCSRRASTRSRARSSTSAWTRRRTALPAPGGPAAVDPLAIGDTVERAAAGDRQDGPGGGGGRRGHAGRLQARAAARGGERAGVVAGGPRATGGAGDRAARERVPLRRGHRLLPEDGAAGARGVRRRGDRGDRGADPRGVAARRKRARFRRRWWIRRSVRGCSLVGICLPDETLAARRAGAETSREQLGLFDAPKRKPVKREVRALVTPRSELRPLYLNTQGVRVGKSGAVLQVQGQGRRWCRRCGSARSAR